MYIIDSPSGGTSVRRSENAVPSRRVCECLGRATIDSVVLCETTERIVIRQYYHRVCRPEVESFTAVQRLGIKRAWA
jgi:hypothetical protein